MTQPSVAEAVILFADVVGSTWLYEKFGDQRAHQCVTDVLTVASDMVTSCQGTVVDSSGDEIMALFVATEHALQAACKIQTFFASQTYLDDQQVFLRIGMYRGTTSFKNGHPFGDTVNTAARLTDFARAGQIITSRDTLDAGADSLSYHDIQQVQFKGKSAPLDVVEVIWNQSEATQVSFASSETQIDGNDGYTLRKDQSSQVVQLFYKQQRILVVASDTPFVIGRGEHCDLVVDSHAASRSHLTIEYRLQDYVLIDHSTNGTFISTPPGKRSSDGLNLELHHQEWRMSGFGTMCLGNSTAAVIDFAMVAAQV